MTTLVLRVYSLRRATRRACCVVRRQLLVICSQLEQVFNNALVLGGKIALLRPFFLGVEGLAGNDSIHSLDDGVLHLVGGSKTPSTANE